MTIQRMLITAAVAASTACAVLSFSTAAKISKYLSLRTNSGMVFSIHVAEDRGNDVQPPSERRYLTMKTAKLNGGGLPRITGSSVYLPTPSRSSSICTK